MSSLRCRHIVAVRRLAVCGLFRTVFSCLAWSTVFAALCASGCASTDWLKLRRFPSNPLTTSLNLKSRQGPKPTVRTRQFLRRYDLLELLNADDNEHLLAEVQQIVDQDPQAEHTYSLSELSYIAGLRALQEDNEALALNRFGAAVAHAYLFLLHENFDSVRNPYDPHFRQACDLYNGALEGALRIMQKRGQLRPNRTAAIQTAGKRFEVKIVARGKWPANDVDRFEFVSDYKLRGLTNHYRRFGLGVPLVAVHREHHHDAPNYEQFYPDGLSFAVTAFLRVAAKHPSQIGGQTSHSCTLEILDAVDSPDILVDGRLVPLESDLTTPLAHTLSNPAFQRTDISTRGFLDPNESQTLTGLYMLEPYDPEKIPVLMVHGLWSSLVTWMEMFNDLRGHRDIREHYQFWFYLYPTGQPFWITAAQLRRELPRVRQVLDPENRNETLDQMVLVGHSMGGLIAKMQTVYSGHAFWKLLSNQPIVDLQTIPEVREQLENSLYFSPNPSIRRVVTIATPHRGSSFSNGATQWLGSKFINLPQQFEDVREQLLRDNQSLRDTGTLLNIQTSIDSLSVDSPILKTLLKAEAAPWVVYHNIVGVLPEEGIIGRVANKSDGVVSQESAHVDGVSEIVVNSDHTNIHRHPRTVLEVRRVLLAHLHKQTEVNLTRLPTVHGPLTERRITTNR